MRFKLQRTFEFKNPQGEKVKEEAGVDVNNDYVQYHSVIDNAEIWVAQNFKRVSIIADVFHTDLTETCGSMAGWLVSRTCDQQVAGSNPGRRAAECNTGQVVLSPSSKIWYRPMGGEAWWLGAWRKVMAAYRRVYGFGYLPTDSRLTVNPTLVFTCRHFSHQQLVVRIVVYKYNWNISDLNRSWIQILNTSAIVYKYYLNIEGIYYFAILLVNVVVWGQWAYPSKLIQCSPNVLVTFNAKQPAMSLCCSIYANCMVAGSLKWFDKTMIYLQQLCCFSF